MLARALICLGGAVVFVLVPLFLWANYLGL
jgi:hypothetical protein